MKIEILEEIKKERDFQDNKFGGEETDDLKSLGEWILLLNKYIGKAICSFDLFDKNSIYKTYRFNMIKVAAVSIAAIESIDRKFEK